MNKKTVLKSMTSLRRPCSKSKTLLTTVPHEIRKTLDLEAKDNVDWIVEVVDNDIQVRVEKVDK